MLSSQQIKAQLQTITDPTAIPIAWYQDERKIVQQALAAWWKQYDKQRQLHRKWQEMTQIERTLNAQGYHTIAGIDEVGRGPLAGPVVCASVIMPQGSCILGVNDSKQLALEKRKALYEQIVQEALAIGIGVVDVQTIDSVNIYQATKIGMKDAVEKLAIVPDYLLIDAMTIDTAIPQQALIKGDARSYCIACASIVAKVTRDRLMCQYAQQYPHYSFEKNAGYGTKAHLTALEQHGITPIHRRTFEPVKSLLKELT